MNINAFMEQGIVQLIKTSARYYLRNPRGLAFVAGIAREFRKSASIRSRHEAAGMHVPPLIIASVTSRCNLHCAGCYSRANGGCSDHARKDLSAEDWKRIFQEASQLGISFVLLAGGEPMMRKDIIQMAASFPNMVFPIFTNGTMLDDNYLQLLERNRNLIPVFSIEGGEAATDNRRGQGTYETVTKAMKAMKEQRMLYGASITVTRDNMRDVTDEGFVSRLHDDGCGLLFYVEYVPIQAGTEHLMLGDAEVRRMQQAVEQLKRLQDDMILVSFPGDEQAMGGCLASGRGFFHINSNGGAEPCPFSPYSTLNLKTASISDVLRSEFFEQMRGIAAETGHDGGCTLFSQDDRVRALLQNTPCADIPAVVAGN